MRRLLIYCDGGFGNRFNALVSGLVLAQALDLSPQVVWPVNNWCGASFEQLFDVAAFAVQPEVVARELASFLPERARYQYLIVEDRLGLAEQWVSPLHLGHWDQVKAFAASRQQDIFYYTALIPSFIDRAAIHAQIRGLPLQRGAHEQALAFLHRHNLAAQPGDFFGVQIRKTDFGANGADDDNLFELLSKTGHKRFFVCSDDKAVEARFATLPNVLTHPKTAHVEKRVAGDWTALNADHSGRVYACNVERSAQSVVDALVDLLILSHSQVVKTSNSTFLNTALLLQASR